MNRYLCFILLIAFCLLLLPGCTGHQHSPQHFVILVDTSGSIEHDAAAECTNGLFKLVEKLDRGDTVAIIPVTGDADVQSSGRILRFQKPSTRTAYDADLILFAKRVRIALQDFQAQAINHPTSRTDIFGGIRMAAEEFDSAPKDQGRILIILSDFIEDDGAVNFKTDGRLSTAESSQRYATIEAAKFPARRLSARASLGLLRSKDLRSIKERRNAIRQFWQQYLTSIGVESKYLSDGIGAVLNDGFASSIP